MSKSWANWGYPTHHPYISVAWQEGDEHDHEYWDCGLCGTGDYEFTAGARDDAIVDHLRSKWHIQTLSVVHPFPRKGWVVVWNCRTFKKARKRASRRQYPVFASLGEAQAEGWWISQARPYKDRFPAKVFYGRSLR